MKAAHLFAAVCILSFVAACETKVPHEEQPAVREGLTAQINAQTSSGVDGGAVAMAAAATQMAQPPTIPYTATVTNTATGTGTVTAVGSIVTKTTTGTVTNTVTRTATATKTLSATGVVTGTFTGTKTGTLTSSGTNTATKTATATASWTGTYLGTGTATGTKTLTGTLTGTATLTGTLSITATGTKTNTGTKSATGTTVGTGSGTATLTYTGVPTTTATSTATTTGTNTTTVTKTGTVVTTATATSLTTATNLCYGTWAFCDNFETGNGSGWNVQQGPIQNFAVVGDGSMVYRENDPTASQVYISRAQVGMAWMDSTAEASLKPLNFSSTTATVSLWGRYDATYNADCGYYISLRGDGKVALGKRVVGVNTALGSPVAVPGGISTGTWYDVKLDMQGTTLTAYVNGTQLLTQTDSSCTSGSVGVGSVGASFESDDVRVSAPSTNACVQGWAGTQCGAFCTYEAGVQSDRAGCGAYLDCYATHGCSPETCGGQDDVCGVNKLNPWGTASKEVADQVYKCLGCAGSVNCANPKYYNGTVCADGNPCTWGDTCQNGLCVPDPNRNMQCAASDQCHDIGTCDPNTGQCSNTPKPNGTSCDDSNACTALDTCQNGICTGGNAVTCTASDQCHAAGTCDPSTGACSNPAKQDGTSCDDGNACTTNDACTAGSCQAGTPVTCAASDQCHEASVCDPSSGTCSNPSKADGAPCSDGNACTTNDTCAQGVCAPGSPVTCVGIDTCHKAGVCDPVTGACSNPAKPDGTPCDMGSASACQSGSVCALVATCHTGTCTEAPAIPQPTALPPGGPTYGPGTVNCGPGLDLGAATGSGADTYYAGLTYPATPVDPTPGPNCHEKVVFCDDNEQPLVPQPTNDDLSGPSTADLVACPPLTGGVQLEGCAVDPATTTTACEKDSDCASGEVCGTICDGNDCTSTSHLCGKLYASCSGKLADAPGNDCDPKDLRICADPGNVVTVTPEDVENQAPTQSTAPPSATVPPEQQIPEGTFVPLSQIYANNILHCNPAPTPKDIATNTDSPTDLTLGNNNWGLYLKFSTTHTTKTTSMYDGSGSYFDGSDEFALGGSAGFAAGANLLGHALDVLSIELDGSMGSCASRMGIQAKLFGEPIAIMDILGSDDGPTLETATPERVVAVDPDNPAIMGTPPDDTDACQQAYKIQNQDTSDLAQSLYVTRTVLDHWHTNGTTNDLCEKTNQHFDSQLDCSDNNIDVPNAWVAEYKDNVEKLKQAKTNFQSGSDHVMVEAKLNMFDWRNFGNNGEPWQKDFGPWNIPIGPINLQIAFGIFGEWYLKGDIYLGGRYGGSLKELAVQEFIPMANIMNPENNHKLLLAAGPTITPGAGIGVLAFAGIGYPGIGLGIEGSVSLLDVALPVEARVAAAQMYEADSRVRTGTDYDGEYVPGLEGQNYKWFAGASWGSSAQLTTFSGHIDLVARIKIWFVRKTFRKQLAKLTGFTKSFVFFGGSAGEPLTAQTAYGTMAPPFAFTQQASLTAADTVTDPDAAAKFPLVLDPNESCQIVY